MTRIRVEVPATTANLGPGFDAFGMALDLTDIVEVEIGGKEIVLTSGSADVPGLDPHDNLFCSGYREWGKRYGMDLPGARFVTASRIPVARGLGSSAACIVAGLAAAAWASGESAAEKRVLALATAIEGHSDNAVAAVLGGVTVAFCDGEDVHAIRVRDSLPLDIVLYVPDTQLLTEEARASLPDCVALRDAVFNVGRAGYLMAAFSEGRWDALGAAMEDRLHQPYRLRHVPALNDIISAAREAGALGAALSGGGPAVLAMAPSGAAGRVAQAMERAARQNGGTGRSVTTRVRESGYSIQAL